MKSRDIGAYAAHELRTEIAVQLAIVETTLADPEADTAELRTMGEHIVAACERQERLLEALLTLARCDYEHLRRDPVDLASTAAEVLRARDRHQLLTTTTLESARTIGSPQLLERLVANLIDNAVRHNTPSGRLELATRTTAGCAVLTIANTGPVIPTSELTRLFQPFQRLCSHPDRTANGVGLGLAIVQAIAKAHHATISAESRAGGGLRVGVVFPAPTRSPHGGAG